MPKPSDVQKEAPEIAFKKAMLRYCPGIPQAIAGGEGEVVLEGISVSRRDSGWLATARAYSPVEYRAVIAFGGGLELGEALHNLSVSILHGKWRHDKFRNK